MLDIASEIGLGKNYASQNLEYLTLMRGTNLTFIIK
jgi:hypothetical protein